MAVAFHRKSFKVELRQRRMSKIIPGHLYLRFYGLRLEFELGLDLGLFLEYRFDFGLNLDQSLIRVTKHD